MKTAVIAGTDVAREEGFAAVASAMARVGSATLASGLLSVATNKIIASVLGPAGVGLLATLQQTRQTALVASTMNGQTALVQGASARAGEEQQRFLRTVLLLFAGATAAVALLLVAAPEAVCRMTGLGAERASLVRWLSLAVIFSSAYVFLNALLNVRGHIGRLAALQLVSPAASLLLAYPLAGSGWEPALVALLIVAPGAAAVAAWVALGWSRDEWAALLPRLHEGWNRVAARSFFSVSGTMLITGMAGSLALLAVRTRIIGTEGLAATGRFDAAWSISMNQVTLVLASMQPFFLPALARAKDAGTRSAHVGHALCMAALVTAPVAASIAALRPQVISTLYSAEFLEAGRFLRWTLLGDYLKVASWILAMPMLAAADMKMFLVADLAAYGTFVAASLVLAHWFRSAEAAACAFVAMYVVHLLVCGTIAWRRHAVRLSAFTVAAWVAGLLVVAGVSARFWNVS